MNVTFVGADPRERARPLLDRMLGNGADQIAIACAFLTDGGVELLRRHQRLLALPGSFVVVAWDWPTNLEAVEKLHGLAPGNIYVHLGAETPEEKKVGPGLMHSKVYFARRGDECWLWTGSHNLTASASQGVNCEAAVILGGSTHEAPFRAAVRHLEQCRSEAVVFDPFNPPQQPTPEQTLVIHAECALSPKSPPWYVHLRPATVDYDRAMRPPSAVWLYLYPVGSLAPGRPRPPATAAYSGTLTALNFTEHHLQKGIPADWQQADYVVEQSGRVFQLTLPKPHTTVTPTQGVFRVDAKESPTTVWVTESPAAKRERIVGDSRKTDVDYEFLKFFTKRSRDGQSLVHRPFREIRTKYHFQRKEIGDIAPTDLAARLSTSSNEFVEVDEKSDVDDKFAFIYRAKYRI